MSQSNYNAELAVFKKKLKQLESYKGRHTELITQYIPFGTDRSTVMNQLNEEINQSSNIKSPTNRKNVQGALRKIIVLLKKINFKLPENGIVIFSGNISEVEGKSNIKLFTIEPPKKLKTKLYWCDSSFHLDPLKEMNVSNDCYALLAIDKGEATIASLSGKNYQILGQFTSQVPGKTRAGGQCLSPETKIILHNGEIKTIEQIKEGDLIKSVDFKTGKTINTKVIKKWQTFKPTLTIRTQNPQFNINCSPDHVFFVYDNGAIIEKNASELTKETFLIFNKQIEKDSKNNDFEIQKTQIFSIKKSKPQIMIDISVENQCFIANGLIVHNSSQRFERLREEAMQDFFKRIAEKFNTYFLENIKNIRGIIIGGPGMTKQYFIDKEAINHELKKKIIGVLDLSYTDEGGIREIVQKSEDLLKDTDLMQEKISLDSFLGEVAKNGLATYGLREVEEALEQGRVSKLIISEEIPWIVVKKKCAHCDHEEIEIFKDPKKFDESKLSCSKCNSKVELLEEIDYLEYMIEKANATGAQIQVVSNETSQGQQFLEGFGGVGALLRY